ncbi:MAG: hydroxyacylglutathione hydrolase family protein [Gammaproteobacteria bacterium]|nr:hydroxyacylglutathione hydrolase family protein [Gammaproteobacteria bacterium]
MLFEQIPVGGDRNLAYIIADEKSKEAAIVDPSFSPEKVLARANELKLKIKFLINTHSHFDHINGNECILTNSKATLAHAKPAENALLLQDGSELKLGELVLKIIATPGHTQDSICILVENKLITGDTLFIGDVGLTRSIENARLEFASLKKILLLKDATEIYPAHDYGSVPFATLAHEKLHNSCIIDVLKNDFQSFLRDK